MRRLSSFLLARNLGRSGVRQEECRRSTTEDPGAAAGAPSSPTPRHLQKTVLASGARGEVKVRPTLGTTVPVGQDVQKTRPGGFQCEGPVSSGRTSVTVASNTQWGRWLQEHPSQHPPSCVLWQYCHLLWEQSFLLSIHRATVTPCDHNGRVCRRQVPS